MTPLLDSNILIDVLNGVEAARLYFKQLAVRRISSTTVFEVLTGCSGDRKNQRPIARELFRVCEVLDFTQADAERAAELFLKSNRKKVKMIDFFIAATAENNGLKLATRNTKDFKNIEAFSPYNLK